MLGGLARRATFLNQLRGERGNIILVDTGDLLFSRTSAQIPNARQMGAVKADLFIKTYNQMEYDAFTPGELDLSFGVGNLLQLSKQANFPFLAANLVNIKSKKPVFKPYIIKEIQGIKVGVFGVISDRFPLGSAEEKEKFRLTNPFRAAKKAVRKLKKQCRVIIALAHMEGEEQEMLAQKVRGIHFIINGHLTHHQSNPIAAKRRIQIFVAGARGEFIGQIDFLRDKKRLYSRYQLIPLKESYTDHPKIQELIGQYKTNLENTLRSSLVAVPAEGSTLGRQEIATPPLPLLVGEKVCSSCHQQEHQQWLTTAHARAYQTLVEKNKTSDPHCLACHTTFFGSIRDPRNSLENVQCEACHGPGEGHPEPWKSLKDVSETQCRICHNIANSPNFNYFMDVQKVRHAKLPNGRESIRKE